jgi:SLAP domain-containing protein
MNNNNLNIKLYLPQAMGVSSLKKQVFQEELDKINKQFPLNEDEINVSKTYILNEKDFLEVGFFLRSTVKRNISIEEIHLGIQDRREEIIVSKKLNLKNIGIIPSYTGIPLIVRFDKVGEDEFLNIEDYSIKFLGIGELRGFSSVNSEIENMPNNISFEEEKEILDFARNIQTLKENEASFSLFKLTKDESDKIIIDMLVRNGYDKELKVDKIPISIIYDNDITIAKHIFENVDGIVIVNPHKAKLLRLIIEPSNIFIKDYELSKCKVIYK